MNYSTADQTSQIEASRPVCSPEVEADYCALTASVGYRLLEDRLLVRMVGDDRVPFLHGMCSNDIANLKPGTVAPALLMTEHAHVLADLYVWAKDDALLLETDRGLWPRARAQLEKFLVADDVEMEELTGMAVLDIEGPTAGQAVGAVGGEKVGALAPWHYIEGGDISTANIPRFGRPAFTVLIEASRVAQFIADLTRAAAAPGIRPVSRAALETIRIENGIARVGVDTGEKTIALEARLQPAISFNKGCYVGQETVERASARGTLKKRMVGLRVDAARLPEVDAAVFLEGKEVGRVTSATISPRLGVLGLAILHHSAWAVGTGVTIKDSIGELKAVVSELPFE